MFGSTCKVNLIQKKKDRSSKIIGYFISIPSTGTCVTYTVSHNAKSTPPFPFLYSYPPLFHPTPNTQTPLSPTPPSIPQHQQTHPNSWYPYPPSSAATPSSNHDENPLVLPKVVAERRSSHLTCFPDSSAPGHGSASALLSDRWGSARLGLRGYED